MSEAASDKPLLCFETDYTLLLHEIAGSHSFPILAELLCNYPKTKSMF